eukprot:Awhi_evm1s14204
MFGKALLFYMISFAYASDCQESTRFCDSGELLLPNEDCKFPECNPDYIDMPACSMDAKQCP